jgi:hypothetical protein
MLEARLRLGGLFWEHVGGVGDVFFCPLAEDNGGYSM